MDLSFILIIGLNAILTSAMMVYSEVRSRRGSIFRLTFGISYLLGLAVMQPLRITSAEEAGMSVMMLIFMALWVMAGCLIGAAPTALALSMFRWAAGAIRKRP